MPRAALIAAVAATVAAAACSSGSRPATTVDHRSPPTPGARPDPIADKPAPAADAACRRDADCGRNPYGSGEPMRCFAPDFSPGPGAPSAYEDERQRRAACEDDAACGADEQCHPGRGCGPIDCQADADCPTNYACADGGCARRACAADADCGGSTCALGHCFPIAGTCQPASYCCPP